MPRQVHENRQGQILAEITLYDAVGSMQGFYNHGKLAESDVCLSALNMTNNRSSNRDKEDGDNCTDESNKL